MIIDIDWFKANGVISQCECFEYSIKTIEWPQPIIGENFFIHIRRVNLIIIKSITLGHAVWGNIRPCGIALVDGRVTTVDIEDPSLCRITQANEWNCGVTWPLYDDD